MCRESFADRIQCEVHYSGHVQGVGFRYTTVSIARRFNVVGYVQNLPDGRVRLVTEGPPGEVDGLLRAVADQMGDLVQNVARENKTPTGEFASFGVRH
jgi:acylphosphatase